jgi:hypothetical protein
MGNVLLSGKKMNSRQLSWINEYVISYKLYRTEMYVSSLRDAELGNAEHNIGLTLTFTIYNLKL